MDQEEYEDNLEFWNKYNWDWKSPSDVKRFVDDAIRCGVYQNAWGSSLQDIGEENFYTNWWLPVQDAIKSICSIFTHEDLKASIQILLEGEEGESDPSILDALLKYAPGFPIEYPEFDNFIDKAMPEEWVSDWEEFEWYSFIDRYIVWTLWPPETLARSSNVDVKYLWRIFEKSVNGYEPYQTFRARVALATNPICPPQIIEFLFKNRHKADWLFRDCEEDGLFSLEDNAYVINEGIPSIEDVRDEAEKALGFIGQINRNDFTGRGAHFVENLLDIQWESDSATVCLLAALAKNTALSSEKYLELSKETHPLVRYLLSKNPAIPEELKVLFFLEKPTFTFKPYNGSNLPEETLT